MKRNTSIAALAAVVVLVAAAALLLRPDRTEASSATVSQTASGAVAPVKVIMQLKGGEVDIDLRPDLAPRNVAQLKTLIDRKFYDGLVFHRVIAGFMAQTGDPTGTGAGGSDLPDLPAEFTDTPFKRGVIGMARTSDPNSANSQFFICLGDAEWLDRKYTVVGYVTSGMSAVDEIKKGDANRNGLVEDPDRIISMRLVDSSTGTAN